MSDHIDTKDLSVVRFSQTKAIAALAEKDLSQAAVRKITGDTRDRVSRLYNQKTEFTATDALRISMILDIDIRDLAENIPRK